MSDYLSWMGATVPTAAQRTARARERAAEAVWRINDKEPTVTSIAFRTAAGTVLAAQNVRIELDNRASLDSSPAGTAPRMTAIVYGIRQHATLADTDMKEGYTFVLGNDLYRITDIIDTEGERQGIAVATG